jgi:hypothetical protein
MPPRCSRPHPPSARPRAGRRRASPVATSSAGIASTPSTPCGGSRRTGWTDRMPSRRRRRAAKRRTPRRAPPPRCRGAPRAPQRAGTRPVGRGPARTGGRQPGVPRRSPRRWIRAHARPGSRCGPRTEGRRPDAGARTRGRTDSRVGRQPGAAGVDLELARLGDLEHEVDVERSRQDVEAGAEVRRGRRRPDEAPAPGHVTST